jgi:hypothetical protein
MRRQEKTRIYTESAENAEGTEKRGHDLDEALEDTGVVRFERLEMVE